MSAACIIVAGGSGTRLPGAVEKQFLRLGGRPILAHSTIAMAAAPEISSLVLVVPRGREESVGRDVVASLGLAKVAAVVAGGSTRAESVRLGLAAVPASIDWVLVHDAVRPFATAALAARVLAAAAATGAAIPAVRIADTVKRVGPEPVAIVRETIDRSELRAVQTPQAFGQRTLVDALALAERESIDASDCASLVERNGGAVAVVEGERWNIKITTPEDLALAEAILVARAAG